MALNPATHTHTDTEKLTEASKNRRGNKSKINEKNSEKMKENTSSIKDHLICLLVAKVFF